MGVPDVVDGRLDLRSGSPLGCQGTQQRGSSGEMAFEASESHVHESDGVKGVTVCNLLTFSIIKTWGENIEVACDLVVQLGAQCIEGLRRMLLERLCVGQQSCGLNMQTGLPGLDAVVVETKRSEDLLGIVNECLSQSFVLLFVGPGIVEIPLRGVYQLSTYR